MIALQPHQKIKDPHSPSNGKTVADVSAKHRVDCWCKPKHVARRQKHFDELLRVPCIDKTKVNIHRTVYRSLVTREQPFCLSRMVKDLVQNVRASFTTEHGEEHAAAKDWIDETGGVTCEQPLIAVESCAAIGKIRFDINFRCAPRIRHSLCNDGLFCERLLEKILGLKL